MSGFHSDITVQGTHATARVVIKLQLHPTPKGVISETGHWVELPPSDSGVRSEKHQTRAI